jgi:transcriptional regulator with XRE-family HTH domain
MKDKKRETFIFRGMGFPIKLIKAPMKKMAGEWVLDVDFDKLELAVLRSLLEKQAPLSGDELKFIRKHLNMTTTEFGRIFGVSHVAVLKWERGTRAHPSTDIYIRLYIYDHLEKTKDKDFRNFFHKIGLDMLAKQAKGKIGPLAINPLQELKSA